MRGMMVVGLAVACLASAAEARGYRSHGSHAPRAAGSGGATHRHRYVGSLPTFGPSHFHPVKPYKGFSYLEHEKHPEKD